MNIMINNIDMDFSIAKLTTCMTESSYYHLQIKTYLWGVNDGTPLIQSIKYTDFNQCATV